MEPQNCSVSHILQNIFLCVQQNKNIHFFQDFFFLRKLFSTLIIIRNVYWAGNQYIRMISEGSCDTEDWSNDAENSALITGINYILKYIQIESSYFKL